jgi:hypothetical protein
MFIIEVHYISYEVHYDSLCIMRNEFGLPSVLNLIFMVVLSTLKSLVGSVDLWSTLCVVHVSSCHCPRLYRYQVLTDRYV